MKELAEGSPLPLAPEKEQIIWGYSLCSWRRRRGGLGSRDLGGRAASHRSERTVGVRVIERVAYALCFAVVTASEGALNALLTFPSARSTDVTVAAWS